MQSTTDKKKVKLFQIKKLKTCLKLMINKLARFTTRSDNVYFANNEQASIAVFTALLCYVFYFTHAEHHLIKPKLYNNWSAQTVNSVQCEI